MTIEIHRHEIDPDKYFTMSDVAPHISTIGDAPTIKLYYGKGAYYSWGSASVTTTVVIHTEDFVAIHVGFAHKHGGGQGWHYFRLQPDGLWHKRIWRGITDDQRRLVMDQYKFEQQMEFTAEEQLRRVNLPLWAKSPNRKDSA